MFIIKDPKALNLRNDVATSLDTQRGDYKNQLMHRDLQQLTGKANKKRKKITNVIISTRFPRKIDQSSTMKQCRYSVFILFGAFSFLEVFVYGNLATIQGR